MSKSLPWQKGYRRTTKIGLSLTPFDDSPSGLKQIIPSGNTYREEVFKERFSTQDLSTGQNIEANPLNFQFSQLGSLSTFSGALSAVYVPENDRYYVILPKAIYEYDRNQPDTPYKVADLPYQVTAASGIYLDNISSIVWAFEVEGTTMLYLYQPTTSKLSSALAGLDYYPRNIFHIGDYLYFVIQDPYKDNKTYLAKLDLSDINEKQLKTPTRIQDVSLDLIDATTYYNNLTECIYFVGGKDKTGNPLASIYEFNPKNNSVRQLMRPEMPKIILWQKMIIYPHVLIT